MSKLRIKTIEDFQNEGTSPEILFWVGCAGSFDDRAKRITKAFVKILNSANISFGVLGKDESCTGDPAKRAGNEFLFQMQAMTNIETLNSFEIKTIVTTCPHCFNTIKNEYPSLGGNYDVYHHTQFINKLLSDGRFSIKGGSYKGKKITYHDPCFLGRANKEYNASKLALNGVKKEEEFGLRTLLDVLDIEVDLMNSEVRLLKSKSDQLLNKYKLLIDIGKYNF